MKETTRIVGADAAFGETNNLPREPFAVIVYIHVKPECVIEFKQILNQVADAAKVESSLISNIAHQDPEDETKFMLWEMWADQKEFFEVQMLRDYRKPYEARLVELLAEPREVRIWNPLRGHVALNLPNKLAATK
ncbi:MAG TPA: antibiotic biosynthesis monooxygenase [Candidatus Saccharimonadales bacterium]|nr:antibiotic biosynthesis monooxygenase [Candidatus Saccharimonadales bacterium]